MPTLDLSAYMPEPVTFTHRGKTYTVPVPNAEDQLIMSTIHALAGDETYEVPVEQRAVFDRRAQDDLPTLALGAPLVATLVADLVPANEIDTLGMYFFLYWTTGKAAADAAMNLMAGRDLGPADPKDLAVLAGLLGGATTAWASKTNGASTSATKSPKAHHRRAKRLTRGGKRVRGK